MFEDNLLGVGRGEGGVKQLLTAGCRIEHIELLPQRVEMSVY
jgi:hypothetical protein